MDWHRFQAVLFDLDGVITPTAEVHMRAWRELFAPLLAGRPGVAPYTDADYYSHIDGKSRGDGVRDLLGSRGIPLPEGSREDHPDALSISGLGRRKNRIFNDILAREGVEPYPGSEALIRALSSHGHRLAVVSSSRNARAVLAASGLADLFEVVIDGEAVAERHLAGKPAPDTFLAAAALLETPATSCVVVEDAIVGVQAGKAGGFGLVIGVDRGAGRAAMEEAGADLVVTDLSEVVEP